MLKTKCQITIGSIEFASFQQAKDYATAVKAEAVRQAEESDRFIALDPDSARFILALFQEFHPEVQLGDGPPRVAVGRKSEGFEAIGKNRSEHCFWLKPFSGKPFAVSVGDLRRGKSAN